MKKLMIMLSAVALAAGAFAAEAFDDVERNPTPIALNLASPLQLPPYDRDVWGLRLNLIYGHSLNVYGLDCGVVGLNKGDVAGVQTEAFNWADGNVYGLQVAGICNYVTGDFYGLQAAAMNWNLADTYGLQVGVLDFGMAVRGLQVGGLNWDYGSVDGGQVGAVNVARHDVTGAAIGALNYSHGNLTGCQIGAFNFINGTGRGMQIGVINSAQRFYGVQLGLVNINVMGRLPIMVIANANF